LFHVLTTLRPSTAFVAILRTVLAIWYGRREKRIGRLRVGFLRHGGALARRYLVVALATRGCPAGLLALRAGRRVVVERVVELRSL